MNTSVVMTREEPPKCFGKEWDKRAAECAGGPDADFIHPRTKQHIREQCNFFQSCGSRFASSHLIPAQSLVRPPVITPPPQPTASFKPPLAPTWADYLRNEHAKSVEAARQVALNTAAATTTAASPQSVQHVLPGSGHHPAPLYQLNYMMPGYLTVPEERHPGETLWSVLLREVIRSVFKALGHSFSHFFDVRRMKEKDGP